MGQVLVRNVPDEVIERLKARAAEHGRSLEAELRSILSEACCFDREGFIEEARAIRERARGQWDLDSTALIREDRDR